MIFRVSILVVASVAAAFVVSPVDAKRLKKKNSMVSDCSSSQEMDMEEETKGGNGKNVEKALKPNLRNCEKLQFDGERMLGKKNIEHYSQNLIKKLEKRRVNLEGKLFELYSRKEKLSSIALMERNLDDKTAEVDKLNLRIYALKEEIKDLQGIVRQGYLAMNQLEVEKKMIGEMQMKNGNASHVRGQIMVLEEQLSGFKADESSARDSVVKKKLEAVKSIELEAVKMKRINKELELEKRELSVKLLAACARISSLSEMTENKSNAKISELRQAKVDISKEVERLQKSRFDMVEELVYQRWLNACLRAEIRDHQTSARKAMEKELQKTSSSKELGKITTQHPDMKSSSSSITSSTESEDVDSSTIESSLSGNRSIGKDSCIGYSTSCSASMDGSSVVVSPNKFPIGSPLEGTGLVCKDYTSMVPSMLDFTETLESPNLTKVRRVSFNDAEEMETVSSANQVLLNFVGGVFDEMDIMTLVSKHKSITKTALQSQTALAGEKHEFPSSEVFQAKSRDSKMRSVDKDGLHSSISNVAPNENKMDANIMHTVFAFIVLLFALLVCFLHISARIS